MAVLRGMLDSFDAGTFTAVVRLDGSTATTLTGVKCARFDAGVFVAGRRVILDTGDHGDATDAVVTSVYT